MDLKNIKDIKIKLNEYQKANKYNETKLILDIEGIPTPYSNALSRIMDEYVPTYGFPVELIEVEEHKSACLINNDLLKLRFTQLPIFNIDTKFDFDSGIEYIDEEFLSVSFKDDKYKELKHNYILEMYLNIENNKDKYDEYHIKEDDVLNDMVYVTTDHASFYLNGEYIDSPYMTGMYAPLLIKLKKNEKIKCKMTSALSNGLKHKIFSSIKFCHHDLDTNQFIIESIGQLNEIDLLNKAIKIVIKKLMDFKIYFKEDTEIDRETNKLIFIFENEDYTMGNLLNYTFQSHKKISYSGYNIKSGLERNLEIKIMCEDEKDSPLIYMDECIDYLLKFFDEIQNQIDKIKLFH
jgi:DNA-directed RNA polymerase subunit L